MTGSRIVLLAGPIAVGKTTTAQDLADTTGGQLVRVRQAIEEVTGLAGADRATLQRGGADLDRRTSGKWLLDYLESRLELADLVVVDAMRTIRQTEPVLDHFVDGRLLYLSASETTRRQRYALGAASDVVKSGIPFDQAMAHPTESAVRDLVPLAHLVVETDELDPTAVAALAAQMLGC